MVRQWGFNLLPRGSVDQVQRFNILIGYPFGVSTPTPGPPDIIQGELVESAEDINYYRTYLAMKTSPPEYLLPDLVTNYSGSESDEDLVYYKSYLGKK